MAFSKAPLERMPFLKVDPVIPGPGAYDIPSPEKEASAISIKGVQQAERKEKVVHENPIRKGKENKRQKAVNEAPHSPAKPHVEIESQRARDLAHLKTEAMGIRKENESLNKAKAALEREVEARVKDVEKAEKKLAALETKLRDTEVEKKSLASERQTLEREAKDLASRLSHTEQELEKVRAKKENKEWQAKCEAATAQLQSTKAGLAKTEAELAARLSQISELETRLVSGAAALAASEAKFAAETAEMIAKQAAQENTLAKKEATLHALKSELAESEAVNEELKAQFATLKSASEADTRHFNEQSAAWQQREVQTSERHAAEQAAAAEKISKSEATLQTERAAWAGKEAELKAAIATLQGEASVLSATLNREREERKRESEAAEKALSDLHNMIAAMEARILSADREIETTRSEIAEIKEFKAKLKEELTLKNALMAKQSDQLSSALASLVHTETALSTQQRLVVDLSGQLKETERSLAEVRAAKLAGEEKTGKEINMLNVCILDNTSQISSLTLALRKAEQGLKEERQRTQELSAQLNLTAAELSAAKSEATDTEERLQAEVQRLATNLAAELSALADLQKRYADLSATESELRGKHAAATHMHVMSQQLWNEERERMQGELVGWREAKRAADGAKSKLEVERADLTSQVASLTSELASRASELALLESAFTAYKTEAEAKERDASERLAETEQAKGEAEAKLRAFESNASEAGTRYEALQQNRQELLDRIGALTETLNKREQQIKEQRVEYARAAHLAQSEVLEMTANMQKVLDERRQALAQLDSTRAALENVKSEKDRERERADRYKEAADKSAALQQELANARFDLDAAQAKTAQERESLLQYAEQLRQEHSELQARTNGLTRENQQLANESARLREYLESAYASRGELDKMQAINRELAAMNDGAAQALDELTRQNAALVGHTNHKQKIQMHLKVKEENNQLRLERVRMETALRARDDHIRKLEAELARAESGRTKASLTMTPAPAARKK